jgi:hypothetical protein
VTRFSPRYALALAVVLALALVGILYGRLEPERDECAKHEVLLDPRAFSPPIELVHEGPRATDLANGRLTGIWPEASGRPVAVTVGIARTRGLSSVILQPAMVLPGRNEPDDIQVSVLETPEGKVPIHYAYERRGRYVRVTAYLMAHRGKAIRAPLSTRLRSGPASVWNGSWPITLFAAALSSHASVVEARRAFLDEWLVEAWVHYRKVCGTGSAS